MDGEAKARAFLDEIRGEAYSRLAGVKMPPREVLEAAQREVLEQILRGQAGRYDDEALERVRGEAESYIEAVLETQRRGSPGAVLDFYGSLLVTRLSEQIEGAVKDLAFPMPRRPVVGSLPTGRVNAMAIAVPSSNEYVVILEDQLFHFANLLSKATAAALPVVSEADGAVSWSVDATHVDRRIADEPEITQRFREVLLAYLLVGEPAAAPQYVAREPHGNLAGILRDSMELFVVGHEYGHIIEGHLGEGSEVSTVLADRAVQETVYRWEQELVADSRGASLGAAAMGKAGHGFALSYWGADFFFSCVELVERGLCLIRTGQEDERPAGSHPPPELRRESLRRSVGTSLSRDLAEPAVQLGEQVQSIIEKLWTRTRPVLQDAHRQRTKLAPRWG